MVVYLRNLVCRELVCGARRRTCGQPRGIKLQAAKAAAWSLDGPGARKVLHGGRRVRAAGQQVGEEAGRRPKAAVVMLGGMTETSYPRTWRIPTTKRT